MIRVNFILAVAALGIAVSVDAQLPPDSSVRVGVHTRTTRDSAARAGTSTRLAPRERGASITVLDADLDGLNSAPSLPIDLQARVPGVSVIQGNGLLGSDARLWLRGPGSLYVNEPLVIIDGVRTHSAQPFSDTPSRLEHIDPETIERIEILPGIASAAIHGPAASKGVILVTTKRGAGGPTRWSAFAESGPLLEPTSFPANHGTLGVSLATNAPVANCPLADQAARLCAPMTRQSFNPLEQASHFRVGMSHGIGLQASGGTAAYTWFAAAGHDRADGVYDTDWSRTTNGRVALSAALSPTIDVAITGGRRAEVFRHPWRSHLSSGLLGKAIDDPVTRGYDRDLRSLELGKRTAEGRRTTLSTSTVWRPRSWLRTTAMFGLDELSEAGRAALPLVEGPPGSGDFYRLVETETSTPRARTMALNANASYHWAGMTMSTMLGIEHLRENHHRTTFEGTEPDRGSYSVLWVRGRRRSTGVLMQQQAAWDNRLFLTGSLRIDRPEKLDMDDIVSRSAEVAWIAVEQPDSTAGRAVGELRLRAAYGRGGSHLLGSDHPDNDGMWTYRRETETAERMEGFEVGADGSLFDNRANLSFTAYRATNEQGLIPLAGQWTTQLSNGARFRTSGIETALNLRLVNQSPFAWDIGVVFAAHDNEVRSLPTVSQGTPSGVQSANVGHGIGDYYQAGLVYEDTDGDGRIALTEVSVAGPAMNVGSPFPNYEAALRSSVAFAAGLRVSGVIDRRSGQHLANETATLRCYLYVCEDQHELWTPFLDQARAVYARRGYRYVEDASYTKLREIRLELTLPHRWAMLAGATSARIALSGRNLYTWTSYTGSDPEVGSEDRNGYLVEDRFYQPPLRSFSARLDLTW